MFFVKKKGRWDPVNSWCEDCGLTAQQAYPLSTLEEVLDMSRSGDTFAECFSKARACRLGTAQKDFRAQDVSSQQSTGYTVTKVHVLLTIDEFGKRFGMPPKSVPGLKIDELMDEEGVATKFVVVRDDGSLPPCFRRLTVKYSSHDASITEGYQSGGLQLRKEQGNDCFKWLSEEKVKRRSARIRRGAPLMSPDDIMEAIKTVKDNEAQSSAQAMGAAEGKEQGHIGRGRRARDTDSDEEDSDDEDGESESDSDEGAIVQQQAATAQPILSLDDDSKRKGGGKGGRKGRGSGRGRGRGLSGLMALGTTTATSQSEAAGSGGNNDDSSSIYKAGTPEKLKTNVSQYTRDIDLSELLLGRSLNDKIYQAKRTLIALEKVAGTEGDQVMLTAHLRLADICKACVPDQIPKLQKQVRISHFQQLSQHGVEIPASVQSALIAQYAKETGCVASAGGLDELIEILVPSSSGGPFDALKPRLAQSSLSPEETVKVMQRCLVNELLIPLIRQGEAVKDHMLAVAGRIVKALSETDEMSVDPVVQINMKEMCDIWHLVQGIIVILPMEDGASPDDISEFADPMQFKRKTSQKKVAFEAMQQNAWWTASLKTFVTYAAALATHGRDVKDALAKMRGEPTLTELADIASKFRVWTSEMPASTMGELQNSITTHMSQKVDEVMKLPMKEKASGLQSLKLVADTVCPAANTSVALQLRDRVLMACNAANTEIQASTLIEAIQSLTEAPSPSAASALLKALDGPLPKKLLDSKQHGLIAGMIDGVLKHILVGLTRAAAGEHTVVIDAALRAAGTLPTDGAIGGVDALNVLRSALKVMKAHLDLDKVEGLPEKHKLLEALATCIGEMQTTLDEKAGRSDGDDDGPLAEVKVATDVFMNKAREAAETTTRNICEANLAEAQKAVEQMRTSYGDGKPPDAWKQGLPARASLDEFVEKAKTDLLHDPAVAKQITDRFRDLKEASPNRSEGEDHPHLP